MKKNKLRHIVYRLGHNIMALGFELAKWGDPGLVSVKFYKGIK